MCCSGAILRLPVIIFRAWFWDLSNLFQLFSEMFGLHMGHAYSNTSSNGLVGHCHSLLVLAPVGAREWFHDIGWVGGIFLHVLRKYTLYHMWHQGVLDTSTSSIMIFGWTLNSLVSGVKSVTVNFSGDTTSSLSFKKSITLGKYLFMDSVRTSMFKPVA